MLAYRRALPEWLLYVSVVVDMALLLGLIYFLHYKYAQTAVFNLKAPALLYVFLFIALRALRFEARFVIFAGLTAAAGWLALIFYALSGRGGPPNETTDFVEYMTSNAFLIQAEVEKLLAILLTTAVLAIAISRARHLLVRRSAKAQRRATWRASSIPASPTASAAPPCRSRRARASCATSPS